MAHFAKINSDSVVESVIVVSNADCGNLDFPDSEPIGQSFLASLGLEGEWKQTSYSNSFRGVYAGTGYTYNVELDEFVVPPRIIIPE